LWLKEAKEIGLRVGPDASVAGEKKRGGTLGFFVEKGEDRDLLAISGRGGENLKKENSCTPFPS